MSNEIALRPLTVPEDYEGLAALLNAFWSEPVTAQRLEEDDAHLFEVGDTYMDGNGLLAGYDRTRYVAVTAENRIVGYVWSWRAPWTEPGYLNNTIIVEETYRGRGIGERLLKHALQWGEQLGASMMVSEIWDDNPEARTFVERRGFKIERHSFQSVLELADARPDLLGETQLFEELAREGIRFATLAEVGATEENERKLYEVFSETARDIPGFTGEVPNIDDWRKWYFQVEGYTPKCVLLALNEEDQCVAVSNIPYKTATNGMYHEYTGVRLDYRGRKIARALKIRAVQLAKQLGASYLKTDNDSHNLPILRINRSLGYVPLRGSYRIVAELQTVKEAISDNRE
ncbi:GNAT family N-acetyltransferase [Cohnella sp. GCM10027633]|uniref:GNAT family N-acetyltransferase n=1 Tax=unclassified Cohnella TaxID=2636738 RepID=UPI003629497F